MTDETMVMDTLKINVVQGSISGISQDDYNALEVDMKRYFAGVTWEKEKIFIDNTRAEPHLGTYNRLENLLARISDHIADGKYGKLGFIGLVGKREIVGIIFLAKKKWELREFKRPEMPNWYKIEDWYKKERWEEEIQWDELFGRSYP
jgi:hypothetical protein